MYKKILVPYDKSDPAKNALGAALDLAAGLEDYRALAAINNALAIYTSEMEMNYLEGLSYFMKALKYAEQSSDKHSYPVILNNIAMAHYLRNDPNGLKYSLEVIDIGQRRSAAALFRLLRHGLHVLSAGGLCRCARSYRQGAGRRGKVHRVRRSLQSLCQHTGPCRA